ncbi:restriction endonuclease subunit S [Acinetobacter indicus]|nr:restriction endonuclease subunit S [Acinetobacter indicus]
MFGFSSSIGILRPNKEKISSEYLYHVMNGEDFKNNHSALNAGSVQGYTNIATVKSLRIPLPSLNVQKNIAKILTDFDKKIHLNNQINQTLESIAQAIFKSWFIDFEPVRAKIAAKQEGKDAELAAMCVISGKSEEELKQMAEDDFAELQATAALFPDELVESELGDVPRGWVVSTVGEQVQTVGGGTPSTKNADFWDNGIHHWTTPKDLSNLTDKILLNTERKITDIGLKKISSGILPKDTVLMSSRAPVGYLALAKIEVAINQGYIAILPNTKYSAEYLIQWCEANMAEIKGRASGTTFQEISKKNFREISFVCPDDKVVVSYTKTVKTLYDEITSKAKENQSLINLRDTLLPKLMSGEISLNKNMGSIDD